MTNGDARYLYSIACCKRREWLGKIGLEESTVYTIPWRDIAAIVHSCQPAPYRTKDKRLAEEWVLEHGYVIDQATKRFGTVLPFSFDVIVRGDDMVIEQWLRRNYDGLKVELEKVKGKSEYSVQILYDQDKFASKCSSADEAIKELEENISKKSKGMAYLLQRKLDLVIKDKISTELAALSEEFGARIKELSEDVKVENRKTPLPDKYQDKRPLISFACLVCDNNVVPLGKVLDEINSREGFAVRFMGPWAPFSFVNLSEAQ